LKILKVGKGRRRRNGNGRQTGEEKKQSRKDKATRIKNGIGAPETPFLLPAQY
jgi:hypothetical protein